MGLASCVPDGLLFGSLALNRSCTTSPGVAGADCLLTGGETGLRRDPLEQLAAAVVIQESAGQPAGGVAQTQRHRFGKRRFYLDEDSWAIAVVDCYDGRGELARLFGDIGEIGVNIEDLRIDHDPARPVGLVELFVGAGEVDHLLGALADRGWTAHR